MCEYICGLRARACACVCVRVRACACVCVRVRARVCNTDILSRLVGCFPPHAASALTSTLTIRARAPLTIRAGAPLCWYVEAPPEGPSIPYVSGSTCACACACACVVCAWPPCLHAQCHPMCTCMLWLQHCSLPEETQSTYTHIHT